MSDSHVEHLFFQALETTSPEERAAFLERECQGDSALKTRIERLLQANEGAEAVFPSVPRVAAIAPETLEQPGTHIDRYRLLEQIGEGGFGVVYMAEQEEPVRRKVALKIIKLGMDTRQVIARFEAERQALAMMDHPNIAKVLDAGATDTGRPYFVMELVRGVPITEFCEDNRLSIKDRLELFIPVCQAIQHAHQKGVIHRDIKPSNVLVTMNEGVPHPMVIDFGVAKAVDQRLTEKTLYTRFAQMIGTPAYMSPEQAEMSKQDVDTRTDVYSLGILLYELLTGTTPFPEDRLREAGYAEIQRIISQEEPVRPSTLLSRLNGRSRAVAASRRCEPASLMKLIKGDLDWIVLRAIDKDRNRRYATPNELAADLQRHLVIEPVTATPPSVPYRIQKFILRNRTVTWAGLAVAASLICGLYVASWQAFRAMRSEADAKLAQGESEAASQWARLNQYSADINLAQHALLDNETGRARGLLSAQVPTGSEEDLRGWEWWYLWSECRSDEAYRLGEHPDVVRSVAMSPSGREVASADMSGTVVLWDWETRQPLWMQQEPNSVHQVLFYSEAAVVTAGHAGTITFYAAATGEVLSVEDVGASVRAIAVSPSQDLLAGITGPDGGEVLHVWASSVAPDTKTPPAIKPLYRLPGPDRLGSGLSQGALAFSPNGADLAAGYTDTLIRIYEATSGKERRVLVGHQGGAISTLAYSPDGRWLASGSMGTHDPARIWDADTGEIIAELSNHAYWITRVLFSSRGDFLLTSSADQTIRLWKTSGWSEQSVLRGHEWSVNALALSASDDLLVSSGIDQTLRVWDLSTLGERKSMLQVDDLQSFDFSPVTRILATVELTKDDGAGYQAGLRSLDDLRERVKIPELGDDLSQILFTSDGRELAALGREEIRYWELDSKAVIRTNALPDASRHFLVGFTDHDDALLVVSDDQLTVSVWETASGRMQRAWSALGTHPLPNFFSSRCVAFHADSNLLVLGLDGVASVWDTRTMVHRGDLGGHQFAPVQTAISPDGLHIATIGDDGRAFLWDATTLGLVREFQTPRDGFFSGAFSPDGKRLAIGIGGRWLAGVFDVATGRELVLLPGTGDVMSGGIGWSPDNSTLVALGAKGYIWQIPSSTDFTARR